MDEQARCKELYDTVRNHEQTIRKSNQETESLNFRNVQLSRRVVVLQEELDNLQVIIIKHINFSLKCIYYCFSSNLFIPRIM